MISITRSVVGVVLVLLTSSGWAENSLSAQVLEQRLSELISHSNMGNRDTEELKEQMDLPLITRSVIAGYRGEFTLVQQAEFEVRLRDSIVSMLGEISRRTNDRPEVHVQSVRQLGEKRAVVNASLLVGSKPLQMSLAFQKRESLWRIKNLMLEGVNVGKTLKRRFNALMRTYDGDMELVVANWPVLFDEFSVDAREGRS